MCFACNRLLGEKNALLREMRNLMEKSVVNEREITRLNESNNNLEKKIQQHQASENVTKQAKAIIDSEMAKLKVFTRHWTIAIVKSNRVIL